MTNDQHESANVHIIIPHTREEMESYYHLRWKLLREPWDQPEGSERDAFDVDAHHVAAVGEDGQFVGVGRLHLSGPAVGQIRYMGVTDEYRNKGVGHAILEKLESIANEEGARFIIMNAREHSVSFFEHAGYRVTGVGYVLFDSINHSIMIKCLEE